MLAVALLQIAWGANSLETLIGMFPCALFYHITNLDRTIVSSRSSQFWTDLLESVVLGSLATALLFCAFRGLVHRVDITLMWGLAIGLMPVILRISLRQMVNRGKFVEDVLIVGTGDLPGRLHRALGSGLIRSGRQAPVPESLTNNWSAAIDLSELDGLLARDQITRVVIAELNAQSRDRLAAALMHSRLRGLQVNDAVDYYEEVCGKIWVEALNPQWFVYTNGFNHSQAGACLKRCFDVTFATLLLALSAPLLLLTAIAIKCDSEGPVLFRQVRVGLYGKTFVIFKFRSMRHNAELKTGPAWAAECDERVTRVGRLLRRFRFDELPQVLNVLKGDMSIVGPRPERPCFVEQLEHEIPFYGLRHYLKPGITGWAQVMFRYGASVEDSYEKLQFDFYYPKHNSFRCDAAILMKTLRIVLLGRGR